MENLGEIRGKFENILRNCKILWEISQDILKKYAKKIWTSIKVFRNIIKVLKYLKKWLRHYF